MIFAELAFYPGIAWQYFDHQLENVNSVSPVQVLQHRGHLLFAGFCFIVNIPKNITIKIENKYLF